MKLNSKDIKIEVIDKNKIFRRNDDRYTNFEKCKDEDLLDLTIFEFFLRDKDFYEQYNNLKRDLKEQNITAFGTVEYNKIENKYSMIFLNYGYHARDIIIYIYKNDKNNHYITKYNYSIHNLQIENSLKVAATALNDNKRYLNFSDIVKFDFPSNEDEQELANGAQRFIDYGVNSYYYQSKDKIPVYQRYEWKNLAELTESYFDDIPRSKHDRVSKNITIDTIQPLEITLKQVTSLIEELYLENKEKQIDPTKFIKQIINPEVKSFSFRDIFNRQNKQYALAEYFYIYDNHIIGMPLSRIQKGINDYRKTITHFKGKKEKTTEISYITVQKRLKLMINLMENQSFRNLIW